MHEKLMDVIKELDVAYIAKEDKIVELDNPELPSSPIVRLINYLLEEAYIYRASDIHIEPLENYLRVRLRVDGELEEIMKISRVHHTPIVTRIKIMSKMDITEKRTPQESRMNIELGGEPVDLRISVLPTITGEKIVIRILDKNNFKFTKDNIGLSEREGEILSKMLKKTAGLILVTGPTGSGKTTTLYTLLKELNKVNKNIVTIEDPVEYRLEGVVQVAVNEKKNLDFKSGLKSILRQDPDVVMIGEIRDEETARIAMRAANTGHLVLATLHTNDSIQTINRLKDMGLEDYLIRSSILCIMSQRLVKKLCPKCREEYLASESEKDYMGGYESNLLLHRPSECLACNGGYKGRILVNEMLVMNEEVRKLLATSNSLAEIKKEVFRYEKTIYDEAIALVLQGETSLEELYKINLEDE